MNMDRKGMTIFEESDFDRIFNQHFDSAMADQMLNQAIGGSERGLYYWAASRIAAKVTQQGNRIIVK